VDVATAANSAVLIAGGGGSAGWFDNAGNLRIGGNAATTVSANASPGGYQFPTDAALQAITNVVVTSSTSATVNLVTTTTNKLNYIVGEPVSFVGTTGLANTNIYYVTSANTTAIVVNRGPSTMPANGTYTGGRVYPGGFNGTAVAAFNHAGGGGTPSNGGYPAVVFDAGTSVNVTAPTGGTQFAGGLGAFQQASATWGQGSGGGGGWFGGGGGPGAGGVTTGSGGGSNYANTQMVTGISYGTMTTTAANATAASGTITLTW
jgi:hypothetical protein